ncbi:MAG TPA: SPW repeat protein [Candidatus Binatia bacterium]|nr:SPW repeat protein [Candidatus Binatia bacterium]
MKAIYWFTTYLVLGIWLVVSPYVLNFTTQVEAFWNALAVGVLLILLSAVGMYTEREEAAGVHFRHSQTKTA